MSDLTTQDPDALDQPFGFVPEHRRVAVAAVGTLIVVTAGTVLPMSIFWIFIGVMVTVSSMVVAAFWYETAIRSEAESVGLRIDNVGLAHDLYRAHTRLAAVLDENVLLSDELDMPVPYVIADLDAAVIPFQRAAGDDS